jgi:hypothetical protein
VVRSLVLGGALCVVRGWCVWLQSWLVVSLQQLQLHGSFKLNLKSPHPKVNAASSPSPGPWPLNFSSILEARIDR